jgi:hypothetical protein
MKNFTATISTKVDKDSVAVEKTITFDCSALSQESWDEYAQRAIVVQAQSAWRAWMKSDKSKTNPWAEDTYNVPVPGTRTANPEKTLASAKKALSKLTPQQIADLLAAIG